MEKTLVIVAHPHLASSTFNKCWIELLKRHPERFTLHDLYALYPDGKIDVKKEQQLLEAHCSIVLQFPLYWYSVTPLLKQWLDDVFTYGWAYGSTGDKLVGRKFAAATSIGSVAESYMPQGACGFSLAQILVPLEATAKFVKAKYCEPFTCYGTLENSTNQQFVEKSAQDYLNYLNKL